MADTAGGAKRRRSSVGVSLAGLRLDGYPQTVPRIGYATAPCAEL